MFLFKVLVVVWAIVLVIVLGVLTKYLWDMFRDEDRESPPSPRHHEVESDLPARFVNDETTRRVQENLDSVPREVKDAVLRDARKHLDCHDLTNRERAEAWLARRKER